MLGVNKTVSEVIDAKCTLLAEAITDRQYKLQPELASRYGERGRAKCLQDAHYHLSALSESIAASSPSLFTDYVAWAKVMLAGRGIPSEDLASNLECVRDTLQQALSAEMAPIVTQYIEAALSRLPQLSSDLPTFIAEVEPFADLAKQYLDLLLRGERHVARQLILDAVEAGANVKDIYIYVFQRTQQEIGRLWQMNKVGVAQEHYCTAATQLIMAQLYPRIFRTEKNGRTLIATSVAGELHEIGVRMVADFFEMDGWDTYYLGANTPIAGVLQTIIDRRADVLAISATLSFHVRAVESLIAAIRSAEACRDVTILVGGYPFILEPSLWRSVGANAYARDAVESVTVANRLMSKEGSS